MERVTRTAALDAEINSALGPWTCPGFFRKNIQSLNVGATLWLQPHLVNMCGSSSPVGGEQQQRLSSQREKPRVYGLSVNIGELTQGISEMQKATHI